MLHLSRLLISVLVLVSAYGAPFEMFAHGSVGNYESSDKSRSARVALKEGISSQGIEGKENSIILDPPTGNLSVYSAKGISYAPNFMGIGVEEYDCRAVEFLETDEYVYIWNILPESNDLGWIRGIIEDDKIKITLPQIINQIDYMDQTYNYYVDVLTYNDDNTDASLGPDTFITDGMSHFLTMSRTDNGWVLDLAFGEILGIISDNVWMGFGDITMDLMIPDWDLTNEPNDVKGEEYILVSQNGERPVEVVFDKNDILIKGLSSNMPDSWVKGEVLGNMVKFNGIQYLGHSGIDSFFFLAAYLGEVYDEFWDEYKEAFILKDNVTFKYDPDKKTIHMANEEDWIIISHSITDIFPWDLYTDVSLYPEEGSNVGQIRVEDYRQIRYYDIYGNRRRGHGKGIVIEVNPDGNNRKHYYR